MQSTMALAKSVHRQTTMAGSHHSRTRPIMAAHQLPGRHRSNLVMCGRDISAALRYGGARLAAAIREPGIFALSLLRKVQPGASHSWVSGRCMKCFCAKSEDGDGQAE